MGLEALKKPSRVTIYSDSKYVIECTQKWLAKWKVKGWKTADKKPVKNQDLWERIDSAMLPHIVDFIWVKGHAGHPENERVDKLAVQAIPKA
jgi:ribonuclease HI